MHAIASGLVCRAWRQIPALLILFAIVSSVACVSGQDNSQPARAFSLSQLSPVNSESVDPQKPVTAETELFSLDPKQLVTRENASSTAQYLLSIGVISLAPALILMSTSFVRIAIVLGILRQALGTQQLPPTQVIMALSLFMTLLIMAPVLNEIKNEAVVPYTSADSQMSWETAWQRGTAPLRKFMSRQIVMADNIDDVTLFYDYLPEDEKQADPKLQDVPLKVLLPAFMISELKIAFIIGVQIYLPFLILDIVISSVTVSMGMMMLPPSMISLPFKLLLFVMVDGWTLIVGMLLESFAPYT